LLGSVIPAGFRPLGRLLPCGRRPVYHPRMPLPLSPLDRAWVGAEASVPVGWRVSGLIRDGEAWRAFALPGPFAGNPDAPAIEAHGGGLEQALNNLARVARDQRGSMSG